MKKYIFFVFVLLSAPFIQAQEWQFYEFSHLVPGNFFVDDAIQSFQPVFIGQFPSSWNAQNLELMFDAVLGWHPRVQIANSSDHCCYAFAYVPIYNANPESSMPFIIALLSLHHRMIAEHRGFWLLDEGYDVESSMRYWFSSPYERHRRGTLECLPMAPLVIELGRPRWGSE